jgi:hypothetical protein
MPGPRPLRRARSLTQAPPGEIIMIGGTDKVDTLGLSPKATDIVSSCTVKLVADLAKDNQSRFVGSGVIVKVDKNSGDLVIVTAAHNISKFNKMPKETRPDFDTKTFKEKVMIRRGSAHPQAKVESVRLLKAENTDTGLDLCVIHATSKEIAKIVTPLVEIGKLHDKWPKDEVKITLQMLKGLPVPAKFLNVGFGSRSLSEGPTTDSVAQYRALDFAKAEYLDVSKENHLNLYVLPADSRNTTAPGDSGGPFYMIVGEKVALLAVTLGANYYKEKIDNSRTSKVENNAFTKVLGQNLS